MFLIYSFGIFISFLGASKAVNIPSAEKTWTYKFESAQMNTGNKDTAYGDIRIDRIERGEFGLSGNLVTLIDVTQDMDVEALMYRSTDDGANYKLQPYSLPRQPIIEAMNKFYKNMIMPSAANCSNFPQFEGKLTELPAQKFHYEKCKVSSDGFPQHMPDGTYKMTYKTYGAIDLSAEIIVIVEKKPI
ncbi:uncharacterized protein Dana_GF27976 [Drosophila ananassae]|uniref:Uncharacterized protein n=2 Tax=Drosophila ananassae TaxID=7217 RepID=A0A0P8XRX0_DROAN|nr:uncharacterized protein Dana_GF27976 [Drosophila ananassae]